MSWEAIDYVEKLRTAPDGQEITKDEKLVLLYLAGALNEGSGLAWRSVRTISADCHISLRQVQTILRDLERKGVIEIIRPTKNGRGRFLRYRFPELDAQQKKTVNRKAQKRCTERHGNMQKRCRIDAQNSPVIKEGTRTKNTRTEQHIDREQVPEGLDQDKGEQVLSAILEHANTVVDPHSFDNWLKPCKAAGCANGVLWIRVPNPESKEMAERYTDQINAALTSKEIHDIRTVRFVW